jgi:ABC-type branched-subunit amino acid transport system substrate-binding protein
VDAIGDRRRSSRRGRRIYFEGTSESGRPVNAIVGRSLDPIPAALVACGNCHGRDGRGRAEGGIVPSELRWPTLVRSRPAAERRGRLAYTEPLVGRAIAMGLDPAGSPLDPGMPRYRIAPEDLSDLIAYLKALGTEADPGVAPDSVTVGTLLPSQKTLPGLREAIVRTLKAYAEDVNSRGGLFHRVILLEFEDLPDTPERTASVIAEFLHRKRIFAMVGPYIAGWEPAVCAALSEEGVPTIGPFAIATPADDRIFHIYSGPDGQARALAAEAMERTPRPVPVILVGDDDPAASAAAQAVTDVWTRRGATSPPQIVLRESEGTSGLAALAERLRARGTNVVFDFGPPEFLHPLVLAADRSDWRPRLYLLGASAGAGVLDLPRSFDGRVFLAIPYVPEDITLAGRQRYERLASRSGLPDDHRAAQIAVLASASVLEEGLRRCGREVSRAGLIEALERLAEFPTGFSRPVTFGAGRRVGAWGAYIVEADLASRRPRPLGWKGAGGSPP